MKLPNILRAAVLAVPAAAVVPQAINQISSVVPGGEYTLTIDTAQAQDPNFGQSAAGGSNGSGNGVCDSGPCSNGGGASGDGGGSHTLSVCTGTVTVQSSTSGSMRVDGNHASISVSLDSGNAPIGSQFDVNTGKSLEFRDCVEEIGNKVDIEINRLCGDIQSANWSVLGGLLGSGSINFPYTNACPVTNPTSQVEVSLTPPVVVEVPAQTQQVVTAPPVRDYAPRTSMRPEPRPEPDYPEWTPPLEPSVPAGLQNLPPQIQRNGLTNDFCAVSDGNIFGEINGQDFLISGDAAFSLNARAPQP